MATEQQEETDNMICPICKGQGSILTTKDGIEYWPCPCCHGAGVRIQYGPKAIGPGTRKPNN